MEIKYWIISGVLVLAVWLIKWGFTTITKRLETKFDEVIKSINLMSTTLAEHTLELKYNDDKITGLSGRLKVVEEDIKEVQISCASKCK